MIWGILAGLVLGIGWGAACYCCGYRCAEKDALEIREKENEKTDKILRAYGGLSRAECLERLRNGEPK